MSNFSRLKPFYVSLGVRNVPTAVDYNFAIDPDNYKLALVNTEFALEIVEKASDFLVAIERLELTLNGIPFYDGNLAETITIKSRTDASSSPVIFNITSWSLSDLLGKLSALEFTDPNDGTKFAITHAINEDGIIVISLGSNRTFDTIEVRYPRILNCILGMSTNRQVSGGAFNQAETLYPRTDVGDNLDHIIIQTSLPTNSDSLGNAKMQILTDLSIPSNYSNSLSYGSDGSLIRSAFSTNLRQRVIYTPTERRFLELLGDFPITNIQVQVFYKNVSGDIVPVTLPLGGSFEMKLGFYLRQ